MPRPFGVDRKIFQENTPKGLYCWFDFDFNHLLKHQLESEFIRINYELERQFIEKVPGWGDKYTFKKLDPSSIARQIATVIDCEKAFSFWKGAYLISFDKPSLELIKYLVKSYERSGHNIDDYFIAGMLWIYDSEFQKTFNSVWATLEITSCLIIQL